MNENCQAETRARGATENTRAWVRAREDEHAAIVIRSVRLPKIERRVLLVMVDIERDGLRLTFAVARRRGGALKVCPPRGPDGTGEGVWMPALDQKRIDDAILAAVHSHPGAKATLRI